MRYARVVAAILGVVYLWSACFFGWSFEHFPKSAMLDYLKVIPEVFTYMTPFPDTDLLPGDLQRPNSVFPDQEGSGFFVGVITAISGAAGLVFDFMLLFASISICDVAYNFNSKKFCNWLLGKSEQNV